jgi:hypothetical protein
MAQQQTVTFIDDLDGREITDNDEPTVRFALDGKEYQIDLSDKNQEKLRKALAPFIDKAQRVGRNGKAGKRTQVSNAAHIRAWAKDNGMEVPDRGRIPADVKDAYNQAHQN